MPDRCAYVYRATEGSCETCGKGYMAFVHIRGGSEFDHEYLGSVERVCGQPFYDDAKRDRPYLHENWILGEPPNGAHKFVPGAEVCGECGGKGYIQPWGPMVGTYHCRNPRCVKGYVLPEVTT